MQMESVREWEMQFLGEFGGVGVSLSDQNDARLVLLLLSCLFNTICHENRLRNDII